MSTATVAFPSIWVPRRDLIVPPLRAMMAHLKKGPGGHLTKKASGRLVKCQEVCGCPDPLTLTVSGWTACGCILVPGGGRWQRVSAGTLNGTFSLTNINSNASVCEWASVGTGCIVEQHVGLNCSFLETTAEYHWYLSWSHGSTGHWDLAALFLGGSTFTSPTWTSKLTSGDCNAGLNFTNDYTSCGGFIVVGAGGSATVN